jgi:Flp pilus assembly protein TadG
VTDSKGVRTVRHLRRSRADSGAAAVEFALLLPLFLMLCFGTITGGITFSNKLALSQGVREAARYGATLPTAPTNAATATTFLTAVRDSAQGSDYGDIGDDSPSYCVGFIPATTTASSWYMPANSNTATQGSCSGSPTTRGSVIVIGTRPGELNLILYEFHPTITSTAVARYEGTS